MTRAFVIGLICGVIIWIAYALISHAIGWSHIFF